MVKDMDTVSKEKKRMHVIKRRNAGGSASRNTQSLLLI